MSEARHEYALESQLAAMEQQVDGLVKAAASLTKELKRAKSAAASGAVRDLARALEGANEISGELARSVGGVEWRFDEREYLSSGAFTRELMRAAEDADVYMLERDGRLLTYPCVVRPMAADVAVRIDRKKEKGIRPSHILKLLKVRRDRPVRFNPKQFLEALFDAYELVLSRTRRQSGATVALLDIYNVLTLMPGSSKDYSEAEFLRDIYLLESSDSDRTRKGLRVSFPAATGTKSGKRLATVTREGDERLYYGIAFRP